MLLLSALQRQGRARLSDVCTQTGEEKKLGDTMPFLETGKKLRLHL